MSAVPVWGGRSWAREGDTGPTGLNPGRGSQAHRGLGLTDKHPPTGSGAPLTRGQPVLRSMGRVRESLLAVPRSSSQTFLLLEPNVPHRTQGLDSRASEAMLNFYPSP